MTSPHPVLFLALVAFALPGPAAAADTRTYEQINANVTQANLDHFHEHLSKCPENEVRCLWFLKDHIKVGIVMTLDLQKSEVHTVRKVHDWAEQGAKTRSLSYPQVVSVRTVLGQLPPGLGKIEFGKAIHIAFWRDKKLQIVAYDRQAAPPILQRLYDLGGGDLLCTYAK